MKLTIIERITLSPLLPESGSFVNLKLVREAREVLSFTQEEHDLYKFQTDPDNIIRWTIPENIDPEGTEIELSDVAMDMIKDALIELNNKEQLFERHLSLYEKFVI